MAEVVGYTAGVWDMFHIGHLNLLRRARQQCDRLIVGVSTDELVEATKSKRPIVPEDERMEIVAAIRGVDEVVPQVNFDRLATWRLLGFHRMFIGDDWRGSERWNRWEQQFKAAGTGVTVVYLPYTVRTSSTILRAKVLD